MNKPPVVTQTKPPEPKSLRFAATLNLMLPGAGQFYLGQRLLGCLLALAFIACFGSMLTIFLVGYSQYLNAAIGNNILQGQQLEQMGNVFHVRLQIALVVVSIAIWIGSLVGLSSARR